MGRLDWRGEQVLAEVQRAAREGVQATAQNLVTTAQAINRDRAYKTGAMAAGWHIAGITASGTHVTAHVGNDVGYSIFVDKGTRYIAPRHISASAMDQVGPTLPREVASRVNLT
jgi:hypothetical protein